MNLHVEYVEEEVSSSRFVESITETTRNFYPLPPLFLFFNQPANAISVFFFFIYESYAIPRSLSSLEQGLRHIHFAYFSSLFALITFRKRAK